MRLLTTKLDAVVELLTAIEPDYDELIKGLHITVKDIDGVRFTREALQEAKGLLRNPTPEELRFLAAVFTKLWELPV